MNQSLSCLFFALAAFSTWGFLPAYWKQLQAVPPFEIICHRILWSCVFLTAIITIQGRRQEVRQVFLEPKTLLKSSASGLLLGGNWFIYIWAVNSNHVIESSLGYFINPMVTVIIGFLLLGERFSRLQSIALVPAAAGVAYSLYAYGRPPYFALALAFSFAFYGYSRKRMKVAPIPGLLVETAILLVPAMIYLGYRQWQGASLFFHQPLISLWLVGAGVVTSLPLLWFVTATRSLRLSTIGIMQYIAPSISFALGVFIYQEPFTRDNGITFFLIWLGLVIFSFDSIQRARHNRGNHAGSTR